MISGKILIFNGDEFAVNNSPELQLLEFSSHQIASKTIDDFIYLGEFENVDYFLLFDKEHHNSSISWKNLRELTDFLPMYQYFLALHGQAIANWHSNNNYCHHCGAQTKIAKGGSVRICEGESRELFPRTDPAIITLLYDQDERILLGRQSTWIENRYSNFAGFVEAGESFEDAVTREIKEEAGVDIVDIQYMGSQPWPFPQSAMIAFSARVLNPVQAKADGIEIESLRWYSRKELKTALDNGSLTLPPRISVSRKMIESWYGNQL